MILTCNKCGHKLTKELYPERKNCLEPDYPSETMYGDEYQTWSFKTGCFNYGEYYGFGMSYDVATDSCTGVTLKPYQSGWGCCGNSYVDFTCGNCDTVLGHEHNDCYEPKMLAFNHKKVKRWYKR